MMPSRPIAAFVVVQPQLLLELLIVLLDLPTAFDGAHQAPGAPGEPRGGGGGSGAASVRSSHRPDSPLAATVGAALRTESRAAGSSSGGLGLAHSGTSPPTALWGGVDRPPSAEMAASSGLSAEAGQLCLPAGASPRCGALPAALRKTPPVEEYDSKLETKNIAFLCTSFWRWKIPRFHSGLSSRLKRSTNGAHKSKIE